MAHYNICLDVGGTKVLGAIFNENDEIIFRLKKRSTSRGTGSADVEQVIVDVVEEMIASSGIDKSEIHAIASCAPGVIDQDRGVVLFTPNLPWRDYDIRSAMMQRFGVPFFVGNDVNLGVLGEHEYGAAKGYNNVVGFFVGTGMGGGLILNGELFTGNQCKAAEYGHMILDPKGPKCNCGQRGCLEAYSSKTGMTNYIKKQIAKGRETMMADAVSEGVFRSKKLKKAVAAGDPVACEAVDRACHWLAVATGSMINTLSPDLVLYGGGVIEAMGNVFLEKVLAELDQYCLPTIRSTVEVKTAALGDDSILYGDLALIHAGRYL
ncbi:MAG: ROK family protein [Oscillospiraceae bacterium]|nr:ROK family protein [Oscillospiraceae bacterium]MBQ3803957.1 ROK family protein [Oscillospiraceae bacterium]